VDDDEGNGDRKNTDARFKKDTSDTSDSNRDIMTSHPMDHERNSCPICLQDLLYTETTIGAVAPCGHVFHSVCFEQYKGMIIRNHKSKQNKFVCPTCRGRCNEFIDKLFLNLPKPIESDEADSENDDENKPKNTDDTQGKDRKDHLFQGRKNPIRLKRKINELKREISSLKDVQDRYTKLLEECDSIKVKLKAAENNVEIFQERMFYYETEMVQIRFELPKKEREIKQLREERDLQKKTMDREVQQLRIDYDRLKNDYLLQKVMNKEQQSKFAFYIV